MITVAELAASVADLGFDLVDNEVRELVAGMDIDGDGKIVSCYFRIKTIIFYNR